MTSRAEALATIDGPQFQEIFQGNLNVVSVGIEPDDDRGGVRLRVGVRSLAQERRLSALGSGLAVPSEIQVFSAVARKATVDTLKIEVFEEGTVEALALVTPSGPCPPGFSIGHRDVTAGTFGCLLQHDSNPDHRFILSNNHVLAGCNRASLGDEIFQPGPKDGGNRDARIAKLSAFVPLRFDVPNDVDAAVARVERDATPTVDPTDWASLVLPVVFGVGPPSGFRNAAYGMRVAKVGRTTEGTEGVVKEIDVPLVRPDYGPGLGYIGFRNSIRTSMMARPGDSGSVLLEIDSDARTSYVVGLLFAGGESATYFHPIRTVLDLLAIRLGGGTFRLG